MLALPAAILKQQAQKSPESSVQEHLVRADS
jgi:hypothetical protein